MGMSASQARLLTLTARLSDLEYKAQGISNSKLRLAVQSEDVSRTYSDALNKERLSLLTGVNGATSTYSDLSYATLCGPDSPLLPLSQYGLSTSGGAILVSKSVADNYRKSGGDLNAFLVNCGQTTTSYGSGTKAQYDTANLALNGGKDADGKDVVGAKAAYETAKTGTSTALSALDAYGKKYVDGYSTAGAWSRTETTTSTGTTTGTTTTGRGTGTTTTGSRSTDTTTTVTRGTTTTTGARRVSAQPAEIVDPGDDTSDVAPAKIIAADADPYDEATRRATSTGTTRTGSTTATTSRTSTTTNTYNNVSNPDKIKFVNGTADGKDADGNVISTKYASLLGTYNTALSAETTAKSAFDTATSTLAGLKPTVTTSETANVDYYTNLFNRMADGYATVGNADEDNTLNSADWIQDQIEKNNLILEKVGTDGTWSKTSWKSDTNIQEKSDDTDMARAEANYNTSTAEIQIKDKKFDLELTNIETEHTAVQTEVDSVKKVIDKNIDRSFKMFQA